MEWMFDPAVWLSFLTLAALEVVLGIDNLVFLTIISARLPPEKRPLARKIGLTGALVLRVALLYTLVWATKLTAPLFTLFDIGFSWRDIILFFGGLFLMVKGTLEIHNEVEGHGEGHGDSKYSGFAMAIVQMMIMDLVFSLDSIITAVGLTDQLPVMVAAIMVAILVMMFAAGPVGDFIQRHATTKMLALSFLLLVGLALVADSFHFHIPREYIYFAIAFSIFTEAMNVLASRGRRKREAAE
ncbi:MAG: TerC family protein [Magnetospirillum sp. WYHS-4]